MSDKAEVALNVPPIPSTRAESRVGALDLTKGILVILMVIYHSINYSTQYFLAFRYMAFLPPTFIIITGFLLTRIYRERPADSSVNQRLLSRGAKLLVVFALLNVGAQFVRSGNYHGQAAGFLQLLINWQDTFITGGTRMTVFEILLPISYLLLMAPCLLWVDRLHQWMIPITTISCIAACHLLAKSGTSAPNLDLLCGGLIGMLLGRISWDGLTKLKTYLPIPILAYALFILLVSNVSESITLHLTSSVLALAVIYGISLWLTPRSQTGAWLTRLGHYSLLAYIVQIALLQLMTHFFGRPEPFSAAFYALLATTLLLTIFSAEIVHWLRSKLRPIDFMYKTVFP